MQQDKPKQTTCSFSVPPSIRLCCIANCNSSSSSSRNLSWWPSPINKYTHYYIFFLSSNDQQSYIFIKLFNNNSIKSFIYLHKIKRLWLRVLENKASYKYMWGSAFYSYVKNTYITASFHYEGVGGWTHKSRLTWNACTKPGECTCVLR
jgi:hypothetical protein